LSAGERGEFVRELALPAETGSYRLAVSLELTDAGVMGREAADALTLDFDLEVAQPSIRGAAPAGVAELVRKTVSLGEEPADAESPDAETSEGADETDVDEAAETLETLGEMETPEGFVEKGVDEEGEETLETLGAMETPDTSAEPEGDALLDSVGSQNGDNDSASDTAEESMEPVEATFRETADDNDNEESE
jgi:hypothetical protein